MVSHQKDKRKKCIVPNQGTFDTIWSLLLFQWTTKLVCLSRKGTVKSVAFDNEFLDKRQWDKVLNIREKLRVLPKIEK